MYNNLLQRVGHVGALWAMVVGANDPRWNPHET